MVTNSEIAQMLSLTADLLEIKGENPFKVRAYRNAARLVENSSKDFNRLVKEGFDLTRLPGIGNDLSTYIKEIVTTGKFSKLEKLKKEVPQGLVDMLSIEGLGPKRIKEIYDAFHITSLDELKKYAENGELDKLPGFGPTLINKILKGVKQLKKAGIRFLWADVEEVAEDLREYLLKFPGVEIVEIAGSYRRKKETVGDLDILVVAEDYPKVSEYFIKYKRVKEVHSAGLTRSTVFLDNNLQIDLRAVSKESYGAALHYFTGSKAHNIEIRKMAIEMGMKVNEYGIYKNNKRIAGKNEEEVYKAVGLCYIEPELRENRGEIEACKNKKLPNLVEMKDIKGDLNIKCDEKTITNALKCYKYIGVKIENENDLKTVQKFKNKNIYKILEAEILENGDLDYDKKLFRNCDFLSGVIKTGFDLDFNTQTKRITKAINSGIKFLKNPSCRIIQQREAINADFDKIFENASKKGVIIEIDAHPKLLMSEILIKSGIEKNVKFCINSNASDTKELDFIKYGINQARRGWAEKKDIINTQNNPF